MNSISLAIKCVLHAGICLLHYCQFVCLSLSHCSTRSFHLSLIQLKLTKSVGKLIESLAKIKCRTFIFPYICVCVYVSCKLSAVKAQLSAKSSCRSVIFWFINWIGSNLNCFNFVYVLMMRFLKKKMYAQYIYMHICIYILNNIFFLQICCYKIFLWFQIYIYNNIFNILQFNC